MNSGTEHPVQSRTTPAVSVILPVLNEAAGINSAIERLRRLEAGATLEIIVVDGDPDGSTVRIVRDPAVVCATASRGRAIQMNRGASLASGDILLFLHADTSLPDNALSLVTDALSDSCVQAGAFDLGIDSTRLIFRITERYVALRTRITRIPFGDQAIFIRRSAFEQLGGYREIPIMEDVDLMKRLRARGNRIRIIPCKVRTSARRWEQEGILSCTFRNWMLQTGFALGVNPEKLAKWYR